MKIALVRFGYFGKIIEVCECKDNFMFLQTPSWKKIDYEIKFWRKFCLAFKKR